jgi:imidazolonepropionase-like amidohydrolase
MYFKSNILLLLSCFLLDNSLCRTHASALIISDVRVFDGERVFEHRNVLVEDGKISRIGGTELRVPDAEVVDGRGRTLLPGLIDAHVHVPEKPEPALRQSLGFGLTTVLDMFGGGEKLKAIKRISSEDPPDMADVRGAGIGAAAPGGGLMTMFRQKLPTISDPAEAQPWVDARIAEGSDYIKVLYDERLGGPLSRETLGAIVRAAHARDKLVVAHVLAEPKAREAVDAGVDGLAHMFIGDAAGDDFGRLASGRHLFVIPTLSTLYGVCGKPQGPALLADPRLGPQIPAEQRAPSVRPEDPSRNHLLKATSEVMHQFVHENVAVLAGTDTAPPLTAALFGVAAYGATLHGELKLLVDEGMTPAQALAAATSAPARAFRLADRGLIRPGMRADLILVEGDPTQDILATRNIVAVWKRGVRAKREARF